MRSFCYCILPAREMKNILRKNILDFDILQQNKWFGNNKIIGHSMATANLNKSGELVTNTTAASKYMPTRPRICIN